MVAQQDANIQKKYTGENIDSKINEAKNLSKKQAKLRASKPKITK
jgi:hypothetical protein